MSTYVPKPLTESFLRMLMVDPVCGRDLRGTGDLSHGPVTANHKGTIYFFCGERCRGLFEKEPEQFRRTA